MVQEQFNVDEFWDYVNGFTNSLDPVHHELIDVYSGPLLEPEERAILASERLRELGYYIPSLQFLIDMAIRANQVHVKVLEEISKCLIVGGRFLFAYKVMNIVNYVIKKEDGVKPQLIKPTTGNDAGDYMVSGIEVSVGEKYEFILIERLFDAIEEVLNDPAHDLTPLQLFSISFSGDGKYRFSRVKNELLDEIYFVHTQGPYSGD